MRPKQQYALEKANLYTDIQDENYEAKDVEELDEERQDTQEAQIEVDMRLEEEGLE